MNALDLSINQQYPSKKSIMNMSSWMRNHLAKLYNAVSAPVAATRDALAERLQSVRKTASLLYNRMLENMKYGQQRLKDFVEKEAREEEAKEHQ